MTSIKYGIAAIGTALIALCLSAGVAYAQVVATLDPGASGDQVTQLQTFLAAYPKVYPEGLVTGFYGPLTTAAVERFQCTYNIVCSGDSVSTGYGRVGPLTLAQIESQQQGIPTTPVPTNVDVSAPIMTPETVTTTPTSATITWSTNEPSENSVLYASTWPFYLGTAQNASSATFGMNASVTLTGLVPNHTYFYVRQSVDAAGNVQYGFGKSFTTNSQ